MSAPPHRYDSGVYFDTPPGEAVGCCSEWSGHPIHDVPCPKCGTPHGVTYPCHTTQPEADAS